MDQEKFDQHLMDYLFDELDEVTRAAMKRKLEADAQCRELEAGLRATIEVGQLPIEEPSDDLEERIMGAVEIAQMGEPWHLKLVRGLAWAGSHAMRPQLAMAALLVLVLGSSLLLLRARPGAVAVTPSKDDTTASEAAPAPVAESEPDTEQSAEAVAELAPNATASAPSKASDEEDSQELASLEAQYNRGLQYYDSGKWAEAQKELDAVSQSKSPKSASAALYKARVVRAASGCGEAVPHFETVRTRYGGTGVGADATWEQADCFRIMGRKAEARALWLSLTQDETYKEKALAVLESTGEAGTSGKAATAAPRRAAAAKPKVASPEPAGGSGGPLKAAPAPSPMETDKAF